MKRILITGGSQGIGSNLVQLLTGEQKKRKVFFTYNKNQQKAELLEKETQAVAIKCDLLNPHDIVNLKNICKDIDVLINNAGVSEIKLCTDISNEDWDRVVDVNLKGAFLVTREFIPAMVSKKWGRIVNVSSMWGLIGASCEVQYSASKAGLIGMTKALAKELGPSNITVNCVAPGLIDTSMNENINCSCVKEIINNTPLRRIGYCRDVANLIEFLISEKASFITGAVIPVDGGYTMH